MMERQSALNAHKDTTAQKTQHPMPHTPAPKDITAPMEPGSLPNFHAQKVTLITELKVTKLKTALLALVGCFVTALDLQAQLVNVPQGGSVLEQHGLRDQLIMIISLLAIAFVHLVRLVENVNQVFTVHKAPVNQSLALVAIIVSLKEKIE